MAPEHQEKEFVDAVDKSGRTALAVAVQYGNKKAVNALLLHGASPYGGVYEQSSLLGDFTRTVINVRHLTK
jgi:ankyrin repeat protein